MAVLTALEYEICDKILDGLNEDFCFLPTWALRRHGVPKETAQGT